MVKALSFSAYLNEDRASKTGLYPFSYGGLGNFPDADYLTHAADAILYLSIDDRLYHNGDAHPFNISHLPGHKQYGDDFHTGEKSPFSLEKLAAKPKFPEYKMPPGETVSFKSFVDLVTSPRTISPKSPYLPPE